MQGTVNLPSVAVKVSGDDGKEGSEWTRAFTIHAPSLTLPEAPRLLMDAEGTASLLLAWSKYLREFIAIGTSEAVKEKHREIRVDSI